MHPVKQMCEICSVDFSYESKVIGYNKSGLKRPFIGSTTRSRYVKLKGVIFGRAGWYLITAGPPMCCLLKIAPVPNQSTRGRTVRVSRCVCERMTRQSPLPLVLLVRPT